jgi:hypothetical protein
MRTLLQWFLPSCFLSLSLLAQDGKGEGFLNDAQAFADCMIEHGRDRYGTQQTPLFTVLLLRKNPPRIGPSPMFAKPEREDAKMTTPFRRFDYNHCLNYPRELGREGPHKVTLTGADPYEDHALYEFLADLSRITGEPRYRQEANRALRWWFEHTQGPTGLYPWGEHLGWDFETDQPTYFTGPSHHLYAACYHEIKDRVPFLETLATLPAKAPSSHTPLERYAFGVWNAHYWDQKRAIYCRHGDYTGQDSRRGSTAGFPAHQAAHFELWLRALQDAKQPKVRQELEAILSHVLDAQIDRAKRFGFIPFTFDPDLKGSAAGKEIPSQTIRLARHAARLARAAPPQVADRLRALAKLHLTSQQLAEASQTDTQLEDDPAARSPKDLARARRPQRHAVETTRRVRYFEATGDRAYLDAARDQARAARALFLDGRSPLPKAIAGTLAKTPAGKTFPDFYFRGASLMHAFALLGKALAE